MRSGWGCWWGPWAQDTCTEPEPKRADLREEATKGVSLLLSYLLRNDRGTQVVGSFFRPSRVGVVQAMLDVFFQRTAFIGPELAAPHKAFNLFFPQREGPTNAF